MPELPLKQQKITENLFFGNQTSTSWLLQLFYLLSYSSTPLQHTRMSSTFSIAGLSRTFTVMLNTPMIPIPEGIREFEMQQMGSLPAWDKSEYYSSPVSSIHMDGVFFNAFLPVQP